LEQEHIIKIELALVPIMKARTLKQQELIAESNLLATIRGGEPEETVVTDNHARAQSYELK